MMSRIKGLAVAVLAVSLGVYSCAWDKAHAQEIEAELHPVWVTGYSITGTMTNGEETRPGVCAYRPQDIGKVAIVYADTPNRELIGIYEICDTGNNNIRQGYVLDIWCENDAECFALTQRALVQIVEADG